MSATTFPAALAFCLTSEGGWSDRDDDPGGATNRGVTFATFQHYYPGSSVSDLRHITDTQVSHIYRVGYWDAVHGDDLPSGVDLMCFDFGVNAGPGRSVRMLQSALDVTADGIIGPITLRTARAASTVSVIADLSRRQRAYYRSLDGFDTFGDGWLARTDRRVRAALVAARTAGKG